jgi:MFS family permease
VHRPALSSDDNGAVHPGAERRRSLSFWFLATLIGLLLAGSSASSPLYPVYQERWHFSSITVTVVFAVYALALLVALVTTGSLSDHLGRRPVLLAALLVQIAGMAAFLVAQGVELLYVARILQGVATGLGTAAISAWLLDLQPADDPQLGSLVAAIAPVTGLAVGALGSGFLVQYGPDQLRLVFWILAAAYALGFFAVLAIEDRVERDPDWRSSLRPRVAVPARARSLFAALAPSLTATWALGGLFLSLGPALAISLVGSESHLAGGLVIVALSGSGALAAALTAAVPARPLVRRASFALLVGVAITIVAVATGSLALLYVGCMITGAGFGPSFSAIFRLLGPLAAPDQRSGLVASLYVVAYLAFSLPAIAAGVVANSYGLPDATYGYGVAVMLLTAVTIVALGRQPEPEAV